MRTSSRWKPAAAVGALALSLTACGGGGEQASAPAPSGGPTVSGSITVSAAASLTGSFEQLAEAFEAAYPGTDVVLSFGGSPALAQQIVSGAPVDVFAAASPATMQTVVDAGDASDPRTFARNRLQIAVPADDPGVVTGLADFARPELKIALCAPAVPCGVAAGKAFAAAGLTPSVDTEEQDVKAALTKVVEGEVDAALVYRTDVLAAGTKVRGIAFPEADGAVNDYPIAATTDAENAAGAEAFVAYVLSQKGQDVLAAAGFDRP